MTPRETTDLLAVFRSKPSARSGARAVASARDDGGKRVITLTRRQAVLGSGVLTLAVVLAFVGGTAVGRGRRPGATPPAANVPQAASAGTTWIIRSKALSRVSLGAEDLQEKALREFQVRFPGLAPFLDVLAVEDAKGRPVPGQFRLVVRGLDDRKKADAWRYELNGWPLDGYYPFEGSRPEPTK